MDNISEKGEQQAKPAPKEVALGQWFRPFENYGKIPDKINKPGNYLAREVEIKTPEIGNWFVTLDWQNYKKFENTDPQYSINRRSIIVGLEGEEEIVTEQLTNAQNMTERRLMYLGFRDDKTVNTTWVTNKGLSIVLKLPSGREIAYGPSFDIYIPDVEIVMSAIQMKIEKSQSI